jgi:hypothetical protein
MVYLILKELATTAQDVIMSTSIIMKDTAVGSDVVYRANAIRGLCRIIDVSLNETFCQCPLSNFCLGYHRPRYRAIDQDRHCRQNTLRFFSRFGVLIPLASDCA